MPSAERNKRQPSVYFIIPAPTGISPGQRFRFEHYLEAVKASGITIRLSSFYSRKAWDALYQPGGVLKKAFYVLCGFVKRTADLLRIPFYNYVFVYREATPAGPPVFEWIIARLFRKKIILDFDDAIWVPVSSEQNKLARRVRCFWKTASTCKWAYKVSAGNSFLAAYAANYCSNTVVIPTVVDTAHSHNLMQQHDTDKPVIGWTGTFSTLKYLEIVLPALQLLQQKKDFSFVVIANKDPELPLKNYRFIKWSRESEATDLLSMHIGLMPLLDSEIEKGKCGFKAIQYLSMGIPAVVSPVGVNTEIVTPGKTGFIANTTEEWENALRMLLEDAALRTNMGREGRRFIEMNYSVQVTREAFINLFT
jgi:glycosyltransferase involved in cell wall biosynthesis